MKLEDELRRALKQEQPPEDFAGGVIARIEANARPALFSQARRRFVGLATAATIAATTAGSIYYTHRRQVAEAERVRSEAVLGLRIASAKLNEVHERLQEFSSRKRTR